MACFISKLISFSPFACHGHHLMPPNLKAAALFHSTRTLTNNIKSYQSSSQHESSQPLCRLLKNSRRKLVESGTTDHHYRNGQESAGWRPVFGVVCWGFLGFSLKELLGETEEVPDPEEQQDSELVSMIKKGVLAFHLNEYDKSESLLHLSLRVAQDLMDEKAVTFIFDVLANLAYQRGQHEKAEQLFKSVLKRHVEDGGDLYGNVFVAVSLKLAHCYEARQDMENAIMGYHYCIAAQNEKIAALKEAKEDLDEDTLVLWAMSMEQYARLLKGIGRYSLAREHMQEALQVCRQLKGDLNLQTAVLRNDIGSIYTMERNYQDAELEIEQAIDIVQKMIAGIENENTKKGEEDEEEAAPLKVGAFPNLHCEDMWSNLAIYHINLGSVQLLGDKPHSAKYSCQEGSRLARIAGDEDSKEEATRCLKAVTDALKEAAKKRNEK